MSDAFKRPSTTEVQSFRVGHVGGDTIREFLEKGICLEICCKRCPRTIEWAPPELERRFGQRPDLRIADLVPRLACTGPDGCGSREVAVFPHAYLQPWTWAGD